MARLRDPNGGCPWDLEQTFATIAPYTIEEAYEVADAIEGGAPEKLRDELGDLLFQVVFHARMAQEQGWFDFDGVAEAIATKLIRRHPHVFGENKLSDNAAINKQWEDLKERERNSSSTLADVPLALPALTRAAKLGKRAARVGFDWPDGKGVRAKIDEELLEVDEAVSQARAEGVGQREEAASRASGAGVGQHDKAVSRAAGEGATQRDEGGGHAALATASLDAVNPNAASPGELDAHVVEEFGDVLFSLVNWGRHLNIDPEGALRAANRKFERRFAAMEALAQARGLTLKALSASEWDALWTEAKAGLKV